uniref:Protein sleepless n=1 Tax=Panagrellus redivivus TaxID=6233 RepID=A0A7E4VBQ0_PANRE
MVAYTSFLLCAIAALIPLTESINCYVNDLNHTADNCRYCGFANITSNNVPFVTYNCLPDSNYEVKGVKSIETNVCQTEQYGGNLGGPVYAAIYVCDKDKCNDSCHNSASSSQLSYFIAGLFGFVFVLKGRL